MRAMRRGGAEHVENQMSQDANNMNQHPRFKGSKLPKWNDQKVRADFRVFTACTAGVSLLEPVIGAVKTAPVGDEFLPSPACSSFERFQNFKQTGERIAPFLQSISWGCYPVSPKMHGDLSFVPEQSSGKNRNVNFSRCGFLREKRAASEPIKSSSQKGRRRASQANE